MNIKNILLFIIALSILNFCDDFSDPGLDNSIVDSMEEKVNIFNSMTADSVEIADTLDILFVKQSNDTTFSMIYKEIVEDESIVTNDIDESLLSYLVTYNNQDITSVGINSTPFLVDLSLITPQIEKITHLIFKTNFDSDATVDILLGDYYIISVIEVSQGKANYVKLKRDWAIEEFTVNTYSDYLDLTSLNVTEKKENLIFKERGSFKPKTDAIYYVVLHNNQKNINDDKFKLVISNY